MTCGVWTASTSRSARARRWGSSAPTAPARPRCSACWPGRSRPRPGRVQLRRPGRHRGCAPERRCRRGDRPRVPDPAAVRRHDRVRERAGRRHVRAPASPRPRPTSAASRCWSVCGLIDLANRRAESLGPAAPQAARAGPGAGDRSARAAAGRDRRRADRRRGGRARRHDHAAARSAAGHRLDRAHRPRAGAGGRAAGVHGRRAGHRRRRARRRCMRDAVVIDAYLGKAVA